MLPHELANHLPLPVGAACSVYVAIPCKLGQCNTEVGEAEGEKSAQVGKLGTLLGGKRFSIVPCKAAWKCWPETGVDRPVPHLHNSIWIGMTRFA